MKPAALKAPDGQASSPTRVARTGDAHGHTPDIDRSDVWLVRECIEGSDEAWAALLDKYKRLIYSIPIKYGFSPDDASDVFQEVSVELLSALPRLREPRALAKWLIQVTSHKCARHRQKEQRLNTRAGVAENELSLVADARALSDEILAQVQREQALRDAVSALPRRCRELVHMLFYETPPRPYRQIADRLDLACGSIGFIRGRCLERLRAHLQKNGFR